MLHFAFAKIYSDVRKAQKTNELSLEKVSAFLNFLKSNNAGALEGIFRISGRFNHVQQVRDQVENNEQIAIQDLDISDCCHTVATAFKGYLASCENSIISMEMYEEFLEITGGFSLLLFQHCPLYSNFFSF